MAVSIVQQVVGTWGGAGYTLSLPGAVTAGNLLISVEAKDRGGAGAIIQPNRDNAVGPTRPFTAFATAVDIDETSIFGPSPLVIRYRVATGDEQTLYWSAGDKYIAAVYEIADAGDPTTFSVSSLTEQASSTTKSLGALSPTGDVQVAGFLTGSGVADQTVGTGYTQDGQVVKGGFGSPAPTFIVMHGTAGDTPEISGPGYEWAGMAVGIGPGAAFEAAFSGTPLRGVASLLVTFTDESTGTPTGWSWDFGDGGTSTSQNPTHTYTTPGAYDVSLSITKTGGSSSLTKSGYVVVLPAPAAGVYIDWDGDGFDTGTYDNVSSDVVGWTISRGYAAEITGQASPGTCTLVLKNPSNRYNPAYASGPLYGKLHDGIPIWIGINSDGLLSGSDPRGLFAGRIADITPIAVGGATVPPTVEITCEDFLGWASRLQVRLDYAEGRSQQALREAALIYVGETHYSLADEIQTMPLSHAATDLASLLASINAVNGTRHYVEPADNFSDWYTYRTRNRFWRLDATVDSSLDFGDDHVTATDGWRLSADTVINEQQATVEPIVFTPGTFPVWQSDLLPIEVTTSAPYSRWVTFDDVVRDPVLDIASSGATVTATLTAFGLTALVTLSVASGTGTVSALSIEGRLVRRAPSESYIADDATSQAGARGVRAGAQISGEPLGTIEEARGIADHVVWRYASPQFRPSATVENWFPDMFDRDLFDIVSCTSSQLAISSVLFELVGLTHRSGVAAVGAIHHSVDYVLQECRVQSDPGWFVLDSSLLDGADVLHY